MAGFRKLVLVWANFCRFLYPVSFFLFAPYPPLSSTLSLWRSVCVSAGALCIWVPASIFAFILFWGLFSRGLFGLAWGMSSCSMFHFSFSFFIFSGMVGLIGFHVFLLRISADMFGKWCSDWVDFCFFVLSCVWHKEGILFLANTLLYRWQAFPFLTTFPFQFPLQFWLQKKNPENFITHGKHLLMSLIYRYLSLL